MEIPLERSSHRSRRYEHRIHLGVIGHCYRRAGRRVSRNLYGYRMKHETRTSSAYSRVISTWQISRDTPVTLNCTCVLFCLIRLFFFIKYIYVCSLI